MTEKSIDDDDDGWNHDYDGDDDNIDEIYDKKLPKNTQILWRLSKNRLIIGPITLWKKGQKIRAGASPPLIRAMPESKHSFIWEVFP